MPVLSASLIRSLIVEQRDALAVDRHFDLLAAQRCCRRAGRSTRCSIDAERVVAVGRKGVHDRDAAARAPRRALDVVHLRRGERQLVGRLASGWPSRRRAPAPAIAVRGAQIALDQRRRQRLRVGDVVEAVADRVGRQERVDVDIDVEQIVDGARVLGAVQPLERAAAGIGMQLRRRDRARLRAPRQTPPAPRRPDAPSPTAAASCRRAACGSSFLRRPRAGRSSPRRSAPATARRSSPHRRGTWRNCSRPADSATSTGIAAGAAGAVRGRGTAGRTRAGCRA